MNATPPATESTQTATCRTIFARGVPEDVWTAIRQVARRRRQPVGACIIALIEDALLNSDLGDGAVAMSANDQPRDDPSAS